MITGDELLKNIHADITKHSVLEVRKFGMNLYTRITMRTPVDTGAARANWLATVRTPDVTTMDKTNTAAASAEGKARAVIGQYEDLSADLYIQNNLPYIQRLEEGWSPQRAPGEMVALSIAELTQ
jgi:hypothetical protein